MELGSSLTICICTCDRPDALVQALESARRHAPDARVLVSDDGRESAAPIVERFPSFRWQKGPARGLGANRNAALRAVDTPHVLFLDDDAEIGPGFLHAIESCLSRLDPATRSTAIVTGIERKNGLLVFPRDVDFLGFQRREYGPGDPLKTVVINAAIWPHELFDRVEFDDRLLYGCDEVDLSYGALGAGYRIEPCFDAINDHHPSPRGRAAYPVNAHASRLRVSVKRYRRIERRPAMALAYAIVAPAHLLLSLLKREGFGGFSKFAAVMRQWLRASPA